MEDAPQYARVSGRGYFSICIPLCGRYEGHTDLAPYEFFECCNEKSDDEILGAAVQHYDVVEIDDGIKPAFFYKTEHGYELLFSFDAKTAKKNIREEID